MVARYSRDVTTSDNTDPAPDSPESTAEASTPETMDRHGSRKHLENLMAFIDSAPSPFHAVEVVAGLLADAGFDEADPRQPAVAGRQFLRSGGALLAWDDSVATAPTSGFRIVGAHTDSPNLRIKPLPEVTSAGFQQLGVEIYGGVLLNSWLDRDLGMSGRVSLRDGSTPLLAINDPLLRVPQLAIHLDREISDKGLHLNRQKHMVPVWGLGTSEAGDFRSFLAAHLDVEAADILNWDLMLHDLTPSAVFGARAEFLAAPRIDNLLSTHAATTALCHFASVGVSDSPSQVNRSVPVMALFDHEEVGSVSSTGAGSPALATVLERSVIARGGNRDDYHRAIAASHAVSADGAHATHPNYAGRHEPEHQIALNEGPVLKTNANQRYATDADSARPILLACEQANVTVQQFVTRTDLGCGSTIGPLTAATAGIPVVDFGAAQLSMHSAREMSGAADPELLAAALQEYLCK